MLIDLGGDQSLLPKNLCLCPESSTLSWKAERNLLEPQLCSDPAGGSATDRGGLVAGFRP